MLHRLISTAFSRGTETFAHVPRHGKGQVLVIFAMMLTVLFGFVAFAIDAGFLMAERRQVQSAADAGALAAAKAKLDYLNQAGSASAQQDAGVYYGTTNADTTADRVAVDAAPSGWGDEYVRVDVSKDVQSFFLRAIYDGDWNVGATAVAGILPIDQPYALLALGCGPNGDDGIYINGSGTINVNEGSVMSNCGIDSSGDSNVVTAGGSIDAYGEINGSSGWSAEGGFNYRNPIDDPVVQQGYSPPSRSAAQSLRNVTTATQLRDPANVTNLSNSNSCQNGSVCTMQPGYYGGNLNLNVSNGGELRLAPGVYYFDDSFRITGNGSNTPMVGSNVMLYFDGNSRLGWTNADPPRQISITAPATSPYAGGLDGMAIWIANCQPFLMPSNGTFDLNGVLYAPCSQVRLYGAPTSVGMQVIVGNLEMAGGGTYNITYQDFITADVPQIFLVE